MMEDYEKQLRSLEIGDQIRFSVGGIVQDRTVEDKTEKGLVLWSQRFETHFMEFKKANLITYLKVLPKKEPYTPTPVYWHPPYYINKPRIAPDVYKDDK